LSIPEKGTGTFIRVTGYELQVMEDWDSEKMECWNDGRMEKLQDMKQGV